MEWQGLLIYKQFLLTADKGLKEPDMEIVKSLLTPTQLPKADYIRGVVKQ